MKRKTRSKDLNARFAQEQRQWIEEHGGCLSGYIERYGKPGDPDCYGDGGYAIYAADMGALREYEERAA